MPVKKRSTRKPSSAKLKELQRALVEQQPWWKLHRELFILVVVFLVLLLGVFLLWNFIGKNPYFPGMRIFVPRGQKLTLQDVRSTQEATSASQVREVSEEMSLEERQVVYNYVHTLYAQGELEKASRQFEILANFFQEDARLLNDWGNVLRDLQQYDQAVVRYQKAVELDSGLLITYVNLAYVYLQQGKPQEAQAVLTQALEKNPSSEELKEIGKAFAQTL